MVSTKNCKACKKEIDSSATKCPYCQSDQRSWRSRHKILTVIIGIIGILLVISVVTASKGGDKTSTDNKTSQTQSTWNTKELDALKNGNIPIAVNLLNDASNADIKGKAENLDPATVFKTPWDHYGKILKFQGETSFVQDYPPDSDTSKALGGAGSEIVFTTEDGTIVDFLKIGSTGSIKEGDTVVVYGYPVGRMEVPNRVGGTFTQLIIVGKVVEEVTQ